MKKLLLVIVCMFITSINFVSAQVKIDQWGKMEISAETQDWWSALLCRVPTINSVSYSLYGPSDPHNAISFFHASGYLWCLRGGYFGSDRNLKEQITPIISPLKKVQSLNGVRYKFKSTNKEELEAEQEDPGKGFRFGLIAQDVEPILPEVIKNMPNNTKAISYTDIIAILVEAIKEQQKQIDSMNYQIDIFSRELFALRQESDSILDIKNPNLNTPLNHEYGYIDKIYPNPCKSTTTIFCYINSDITNAEIQIYNSLGIMVESMLIQERENVSILHNISSYEPGVYSYTLIVDNSYCDTKKMIITQ